MLISTQTINNVFLPNFRFNVNRGLILSGDYKIEVNDFEYDYATIQDVANAAHASTGVIGNFVRGTLFYDQGTSLGENPNPKHRIYKILKDTYIFQQPNAQTFVEGVDYVAIDNIIYTGSATPDADPKYLVNDIYIQDDTAIHKFNGISWETIIDLSQVSGQVEDIEGETNEISVNETNGTYTIGLANNIITPGTLTSTGAFVASVGSNFKGLATFEHSMLLSGNKTFTLGVDSKIIGSGSTFSLDSKGVMVTPGTVSITNSGNGNTDAPALKITGGIKQTSSVTNEFTGKLDILNSTDIGEIANPSIKTLGGVHIGKKLHIVSNTITGVASSNYDIFNEVPGDVFSSAVMFSNVKGIISIGTSSIRTGNITIGGSLQASTVNIESSINDNLLGTKTINIGHYRLDNNNPTIVNLGTIATNSIVNLQGQSTILKGVENTIILNGSSTDTTVNLFTNINPTANTINVGNGKSTVNIGNDNAGSKGKLVLLGETATPGLGFGATEYNELDSNTEFTYLFKTSEFVKIGNPDTPGAVSVNGKFEASRYAKAGIQTSQVPTNDVYELDFDNGNMIELTISNDTTLSIAASFGDNLPDYTGGTFMVFIKNDAEVPKDLTFADDNKFMNLSREVINLLVGETYVYSGAIAFSALQGGISVSSFNSLSE